MQNKQKNFDIIGDIHGCYTELLELLTLLGYGADGQHPQNRVLVFVGDLVDRGPDSLSVVRLVMRLMDEGKALCVRGNHDDKFRRYLLGNKVKLNYGLERTVKQIEETDSAERIRIESFLDFLPYQLSLDEGKLVVSHAGVTEDLIGVDSRRSRAFCLYGQVSGLIDDMGFPIRMEWAHEYQGSPLIVYGHTPVPEARFINHTVNIDTGCVFGGHLTALRYPEMQTVAVKSKAIYYERMVNPQ